jgi:methylase of polypeptide subunit release factors
LDAAAAEPVRKNPGFDAVVGNPPFLGGKRISSEYGDSYRDWLQTLHKGAEGGADLVAHFFRRAFGLIRKDGDGRNDDQGQDRRRDHAADHGNMPSIGMKHARMKMTTTQMSTTKMLRTNP